MLVNYRRQPGPCDVRSFPSVGSDGASIAEVSREKSGNTTIPAPGPMDMELAGESEIPEVSLTYNRHVVPDWLFTGSRQRTSRRSRRGNESEGDVRTMLASGGMTPASPPDFSGSFSPTSNHLETMMRRPSDLSKGDAAWGNSPINSILSSSSSPQLHHTASTPLLTRHARLTSTTSLPPFALHQICGGTGATTVNTKLKDHVFATVLRQMRRHGRPLQRSQEQGHEQDDADEADAEDALAPLDQTWGHQRRGRRGRRDRDSFTSRSSEQDRRQVEQEDDQDAPLRRIHSEVTMADLERHSSLQMSRLPSDRVRPEKGTPRRDDSEDRAMFTMDAEVSTEASVNTSKRLVRSRCRWLSSL
jgi:hypothetical protein